MNTSRVRYTVENVNILMCVGMMSRKQQFFEKLAFWTQRACLFGLLVVFLWLGHRLERTYGPRPETGRPPSAPRITYSIIRTGPLRVAKVLGRSPACWNVEPEIIYAIARGAFHAELDPETVAAIVAIESGCNPLAISSKGAVGLMQVVPRVWKNEFDFTQVNLFNPYQNIRVGTNIMGRLTQQHGHMEAIRRYQGTGTGPGVNLNYTKDVKKLEGKH